MSRSSRTTWAAYGSAYLLIRAMHVVLRSTSYLDVVSAVIEERLQVVLRGESTYGEFFMFSVLQFKSNTEAFA